ncbi:hypothetical protein [Secundilactobacillus collinoides]|uniref:Uncharacterized protein n=1 Tax=Secundilactobacillus collinoides DSM 20515 = JCM 1123 TaxID=1423733 RepID=A0A0R2B6P4_SECCO|nr:hypothetical protein [Secundilactobacillus collinoides]KRM75165.1 hypothetical protein FC82_GL002559 [Secundilactobacillus collinoides DSM 20515 = JCM 1123]
MGDLGNKLGFFVISNQILIAHPFKISYYEIAKYLLVRDFADYAHKNSADPVWD